MYVILHVIKICLCKDFFMQAESKNYIYMDIVEDGYKNTSVTDLVTI